MKRENGWKIFFNNHAPEYMRNVFTRNTKREVDFIEKELKLRKSSSILDVGCGTGRHSLELARRGYKVTGIDLSENMLKEAKKIADSENLIIDFKCMDASKFRLKKKFDACICLCEGSFGLLSMNDDPYERDLKILRNINNCLKHNAKFLLTVLNGLRTIRSYSDKFVRSGRFDNLSISEVYPLKNILKTAPSGIKIKEKAFIASELKLMLKISGFETEFIRGGTAGSWNKRPLKMDEMELMVLCRKSI